jgi:tryptophan 7-halogenase
LSRKADLFVDCSGFHSALLGEVLQEPFVDFSNALFCSRAVTGGWDRGEEPILPYTVSDTMENGWCWRIDHPQRIHRGYVFSSDHLSDDAAIEEFQKTAPKVIEPRIVRFRSGSYQRAWVGNVVAVGNASGFVEPLEATALMMICLQSRWLADGLLDAQCRPTRTMRSVYNKLHASSWADIRDFLALHYRFNDRLDNPFWQRCRNETPLNTLEELMEFYRENGPSAIAKVLVPGISNMFGLEGYFAILCGLRVPHQRPHAADDAEREFWEQRRSHFRGLAKQSFTMKEAGERLQDSQVWKTIRSRP